MIDTQLIEARDAHKAGDDAINTMIAAGYSERVAVTGIVIACLGRAVASGGKEPTAKWLRHLAAGIEAGVFDLPEKA